MRQTWTFEAGRLLKKSTQANLGMLAGPVNVRVDTTAEETYIQRVTANICILPA